MSFNTMNKAIILGRLGRDPELKYSRNQVATCKFSVATSDSVKTQNGYDERTEWHNIVVFGNQAENADKFLRKGSLVLVEGRIKTNEYTDKSGVKKRFTQIIADIVRFLDSKFGDNGRQYEKARTAQEIERHAPDPLAGMRNSPEDYNEDDLPF